MAGYEEYKTEVVLICRTLLERGYLKATEGNISIRLRDRSGFAITPSSYEYHKMQPEDVCILDREARLIEGTRKPSIESAMHGGVYATRPDVHVVIHTHQPYASTLALIDSPIPSLFDEQVRYLGRLVDIIPYGTSGTPALVEQVTSAIRNENNAFILQNHGVLVFGGTTDQAIHNMALLERCAMTYLLALLTGKRITTIPDSARELMVGRLKEDLERFSDA